jgi:hypothetical protein
MDVREVVQAHELHTKFDLFGVIIKDQIVYLYVESTPDLEEYQLKLKIHEDWLPELRAIIHRIMDTR